MRIESLPTVIYTIIQDYIDRLSYQQFMDCNKNLVYSVKLETMKWDLSIDLSMAKEIIEKKFNQLEKLFSKVKNKHKQIGLHFLGARSTDLIQYRSLFANIATLKVILDEEDSESLDHYEEFDFSMFDNIDFVSLDGFKQIKEIRNGLKNIRSLKILNFSSLTQITCPLNGFQYFSIIDCALLTDLSPIYNTSEIVMNNVGVVLSPDLVEHSHCRSLHYSPINDLKSNLESISKLDISNLYSLSLDKLDFDLQKEHLELLSNINLLSLTSSEYPNKDIYLPLTTFNGKVLILAGFDVSWDNETIFPNLTKFSLDSVVVSSLPFMPKVEKVTIKGCNLVELPSFLECTDLHLEDCLYMFSIGIQPKLLKLTIVMMNNELTVFDGQFIDTVIIETCMAFNDVSIFRNVRELSLTDCPEIQSFSGLNVTDRSDPNDRIIRLSCFNAEEIDFSELSDIYKLHLEYIDNLVDGNGISNIYDLEISNCENFQEFSNIGPIHHSILIRNCSDLRTYEGLNTIPIVILSKVYDVQNLAGLMNCQELYLHEMKELINYAKQFATKDFPPFYSSHRFNVFESISRVYEIESNEFPPFQIFAVDYFSSVKLRQLW